MTTDKRVNEELIADAQAFRGASDQYAEFITELADALEAATRVPVQGERELAAEAWAIRNEFLAFWGRHSANDIAAVGYSPRMPDTPILDTWHPRDSRGEAVQAEPNEPTGALALVDEVIAIHADRIGTHYEDCYKYHVACLAVAVKHRLAGKENNDE